MCNLTSTLHLVNFGKKANQMRQLKFTDNDGVTKE